MDMSGYYPGTDEKPLDRLRKEDGTFGYYDMYEYSREQHIARMTGCTLFNFSRDGRQPGNTVKVLWIVTVIGTRTRHAKHILWPWAVMSISRMQLLERWRISIFLIIETTSQPTQDITQPLSNN